MSKAAFFARALAANPADGLRMAIVLASASALIFAGKALPLF